MLMMVTLLLICIKVNVLFLEDGWLNGWLLGREEGLSSLDGRRDDVCLDVSGLDYWLNV